MIFTRDSNNKKILIDSWLPKGLPLRDEVLKERNHDLDNFKLDHGIYDPSLNVGLDPDQVGRDIMVNPQLGTESIAANQITDPNSVVNQMYDAMGVDMNSQQMGQAITDTFPSFGYFQN